MILTDIKQYMQQHGRATLGDLALHFRVDPEAMRGMLDVWVAKGKVAPLELQANCNTSCPLACADSAMTIFEWTDEKRWRSISGSALGVQPPARDSACRQAPR